ncbi:related to deoxyribonuclease [Cephalotrichum gorgonifer]|uniref:Related to deoxyribonuclease n=1 Tax=Cephalotrichum gorgonifer TaxID=2041049 RepID=A0AAE8MUX0_9PEZI|nr:related to deoxyribonuclease [Cephalotrichum gorgonifer]
MDGRTLKSSPRYIDIGINLTDPIFRGIYHGSRKHPDDLDAVISRAAEVGCKKLIVTGSDVTSSNDALTLAQQYPGIVYTTAGIHPCSSQIFSSASNEDGDGHSHPCDPDPSKPVPEDDEPCLTKSEAVISKLTFLLETARSTQSSSQRGLVAFGEFGLDYDRLHYCSKKIQLHSFAVQLKLAASLEPQLPLFLHSRAAHQDVVSLLKAHFGDRLERLQRGAVVHSFTGTAEEMAELTDLGLYIGINGCSLKTAENCAVVGAIPLDRLMLETDGPWCEIRPSHDGFKYLSQVKPEGSDAQTHEQPGAKKSKKNTPAPQGRLKVVKKEKWEEGAMVKGRNEPCTIEKVAQVVAAIKGVPVEVVYEAAWANTTKVFGLD